jgi:hypothetical protein
MKRKYSKSVLLTIAAIAGLLLTLLPSVLHWQGIMDVKYVNNLMMVGTVLWFVPAIFIFGTKDAKN